MQSVKILRYALDDKLLDDKELSKETNQARAIPFPSIVMQSVAILHYVLDDKELNKEN